MVGFEPTKPLFELGPGPPRLRRALGEVYQVPLTSTIILYILLDPVSTLNGKIFLAQIIVALNRSMKRPNEIMNNMPPGIVDYYSDRSNDPRFSGIYAQGLDRWILVLI